MFETAGTSAQSFLSCRYNYTNSKGIAGGNEDGIVVKYNFDLTMPYPAIV